MENNNPEYTIPTGQAQEDPPVVEVDAPTDDRDTTPRISSARRKDKARLHVTRHAILSRFPLEALAALGENTRQLRRLEKKFRTELKPSCAVGELLFDRMWSSYLRCLLVARAETMALASTEHQPALDMFVSTDKEKLSTELRHLALVHRYDAHFSREMYRGLGMLLLLRDSGEAGLQRWVNKTIGGSKEYSEG
jgi:hypothetical protein